MKKSSPFSLKERLQSFIPAFNGIKLLFQNEHNSWVHLFCAVGSVIIGIVVQLSSIEWLFLLLAIALVFFAELFNTALERLADKVEPNFDFTIGAVKDYASAAVLIAAIFAVIVGVVLFGPKLIAYL
jgi:diacylglycerol kinase (ATP)